MTVPMQTLQWASNAPQIVSHTLVYCDRLHSRFVVVGNRLTLANWSKQNGTCFSVKASLLLPWTFFFPEHDCRVMLQATIIVS
ncbi:hypothetical protein RRG08_003226 [Elysia crispata]|uniref:Uncharacterized protein n=1 Tax=Elysia crispata TaxID=231223 RepID=A0AAE1B064_9GAST|nr:hypothetical protein RRG08_003226 [Elysia crispata]